MPRGLFGRNGVTLKNLHVTERNLLIGADGIVNEQTKGQIIVIERKIAAVHIDVDHVLVFPVGIQSKDLRNTVHAVQHRLEVLAVVVCRVGLSFDCIGRLVHAAAQHHVHLRCVLGVGYTDAITVVEQDHARTHRRIIGILHVIRNGVDVALQLIIAQGAAVKHTALCLVRKGQLFAVISRYGVHVGIHTCRAAVTKNFVKIEIQRVEQIAVLCGACGCCTGRDAAG